MKYRGNSNNMFQSLSRGQHSTHHCSFCYGAKAVDKYVAGDVNWWTCRLRDRQNSDTTREPGTHQCYRADAVDKKTESHIYGGLKRYAEA